MKRAIPAVAVLFVCIALLTLSCRKAPKAPFAGPSAAPRATVQPASWREPPLASESYRTAWGEAAGELFDLEWSSDRGEPWRIDIEAGDISMPASKRARFGQAEAGPIAATPELVRAIDLVGQRLEEKRKSAVAAALAEKAEAHSSFSAASLGEAGARTVGILLEAASIVDELFSLQNHPLSDQFARVLIRDGDLDSIRFFRRSGGPSSATCGDRLYANALKGFPDRMIGAAMWPEGMGPTVMEEIRSREAGSSGNPFLSPFTAVKRTEAGDLMWMPYFSYPPFAGLLRSLVRRLEDAAAIEGQDPAMGALLSLYAKALASPDAYPFDGALTAFDASQGPLEVVVGPFGRGRDPWEVKNFYEFVLAVPNEGGAAIIAKAKSALPALDVAMARMAGGEHQAKPAEAGRAVRAVDVVFASGFAGGDEPLFLELSPDAGAVAGGAKRKRLIAMNHHDAKLPVVRAVAEASLVSALASRVDSGGLALFTVLSSLAGDLGPQPSDAAVPSKFAALFAAKADVGGAVAAGMLATAGAIGQEELGRFYAAYLATLIDRMRDGGDPDRALAASLELSYLAWHGALKEQGARMALNAERMSPVLEALLGEIVRALASNNSDSASELVVSYPSKLPDNVAVALGALAAAKTPRDAVVYYGVTGTRN